MLGLLEHISQVVVQKICISQLEKYLACRHDYPLNGRYAACMSTAYDQCLHNIMISSNVTECDYVKLRNNKDKGKAVPQMIVPAIQTNLRAGGFGNKHYNGINYMKVQNSILSVLSDSVLAASVLAASVLSDSVKVLSGLVVLVKLPL